MAAKGKRALVYADACVFLDLVTNEMTECPSSGTPRVDLAREFFSQIRQGGAQLAVSSLLQAEVLFNAEKKSVDSQATDELLGWFRRPETVWTDVDSLLAEEAVEIGAKYRDKSYDPKKTLGSADALHLAAAVRLKCDFLITQDTGMPIGHEIGPAGSLAVRFSGAIGQLAL